MTHTEEQTIINNCNEQLQIIFDLLSLCEDPASELHHLLAKNVLERDIDKIKEIMNTKNFKG